jgi:hypothetical protein
VSCVRTSRLKRFLSIPRYRGASRSRMNRGVIVRAAFSRALESTLIEADAIWVTSQWSYNAPDADDGGTPGLTQGAELRRASTSADRSAVLSSALAQASALYRSVSSRAYAREIALFAGIYAELRVLTAPIGDVW